MKNKLFLSTIVLVLTAFSIGGGIVAWFTSDTSTDIQTFSVGTLRLSDPVFVSESGDWIGGETIDLSYSISNIGDREVYIRVKPTLKYVGYLEPGEEFVLSPPTGWISSSDGWWYLGSTGPVPLVYLGDTLLNFQLSIPSGAGGRMSLTLNAEAIQITPTSLSKLWGDPWGAQTVRTVDFMTMELMERPVVEVPIIEIPPELIEEPLPTDPDAVDPVPEPIVQEPAPEPAPEPIVQEPAPDPIVQEPAPEPIVQEPAPELEPVTEAPTAEETLLQEPVTQ